MLSDARKVLKTDKNLPENIKDKGYKLLLSIYNNDSENNVISLATEYSQYISTLTKEKKIETDRKDFTLKKLEESLKTNLENTGRIKKNSNKPLTKKN